MNLHNAERMRKVMILLFEKLFLIRINPGSLEKIGDTVIALLGQVYLTPHACFWY